MDENEKGIKEHMARLIESFAKTLPEPSKVSDHLWKFAKMHDRRSYQLIRFCIAPESDYRTVVKAIVCHNLLRNVHLVELKARIEGVYKANRTIGRGSSRAFAYSGPSAVSGQCHHIQQKSCTRHHGILKNG